MKPAIAEEDEKQLSMKKMDHKKRMGLLEQLNDRGDIFRHLPDTCFLPMLTDKYTHKYSSPNTNAVTIAHQIQIM